MMKFVDFHIGPIGFKLHCINHLQATEWQNAGGEYQVTFLITRKTLKL